MSRVTLGKLLNLSEPHSPHLGVVIGSMFHETGVRSNELTSMTSSEWCLVYRKYSEDVSYS